MTRFPLEIYELIIDFIVASHSHLWPRPYSPEVHYLLACALVSRTWIPRCRYHLSYVRELGHGSHLSVAASTFRTYREAALYLPSYLVVDGKQLDDDSTWISCIPTRLSFASARFTELSLNMVNTARTHHTFPVALSFFRSITFLSLKEVKFDSSNAFIRLLQSFSSLYILKLVKIECSHQHPILRKHPRFKKLRLSSISFEDVDALLYQHFTKTLSDPPSPSNLASIILDCGLWGSTLGTVQHTAGLLRASQALQVLSLQLDTSCTPNILEDLNIRNSNLRSLYLSFAEYTLSVQGRSLPRFISNITATLHNFHLKFSVTVEEDLDEIPWMGMDIVLNQLRFQQTKIKMEIHQWNVTRNTRVYLDIFQDPDYRLFVRSQVLRGLPCLMPQRWHGVEVLFILW